MTGKTWVVISAALCIGIFAGCATTGNPSSGAQELSPPATGTAGEIVLTYHGRKIAAEQSTSNSSRWRRSNPIPSKARKPVAPPGTITFVSLVNNNGKSLGTRILPASTADSLLDALDHQLTEKGYRVQKAAKLPRLVPLGVDISWYAVDMNQTAGLLINSGECTLTAVIDIWRNGVKVGSGRYTAETSDQGSVDIESLLRDLLAASSVMIARQAVANL